jgi:hypothetical protein
MKTKKGFLNLEGGSHSIVTPGNKLDVTAPELKTHARSLQSFLDSKTPTYGITAFQVYPKPLM